MMMIYRLLLRLLSEINQVFDRTKDRVLLSTFYEIFGVQLLGSSARRHEAGPGRVRLSVITFKEDEIHQLSLPYS